MRDMAIIPLILLVSYITIFTTLAYSMVGDVTEASIVPWHIPVSICVVVCIPALLGYVIGQGDGSE